MPRIRVHEKALAHLSRGLYRSPASALRELVSNAWDANATQVLISSNYPNFAQISVQDNGDGFSKSDFERLMAGGIGNSEKRGTDATLINGRPLIGRLGIGLLGIAQICGNFEVASKPKHGEPFRASVRLYDLIRERLDRDDPEIVKDGDQLGADETTDILPGAIREVDVGEYTFLSPEENGLSRGTRITSDDVHPTFMRSFRESVSRETTPEFKEPYIDWSKCLSIISRVHTLHELGDYWKLLWELAVACPLPYLSEDSVPQGAVREIQKRLVGYDFTLRVDNIGLAKPVKLRGNKGGYTVQKIPLTTKDVYGKKVEFEGYLAVQEGLQLKPDELRGILIRIKNVGIGYYDPSFVDYPFNEGPRAKWVTGEIFVHSGLEDALNIDRDSFNRFHPEFRFVQKTLHEILRRRVFPEVYKKLSARSVEREEKREAARSSGLKDAVSTSIATRVRLRHAAGHEREAVEVHQSGDQIDITFGDLSRLRTKKAQRQLAASILALYDIAALERTAERQRKRFQELVLALLARW